MAVSECGPPDLIHLLRQGDGLPDTSAPPAKLAAASTRPIHIAPLCSHACTLPPPYAQILQFCFNTGSCKVLLGTWLSSDSAKNDLELKATGELLASGAAGNFYWWRCIFLA